MALVYTVLFLAERGEKEERKRWDGEHSLKLMSEKLQLSNMQL